jgi:hypothetical protein
MKLTVDYAHTECVAKALANSAAARAVHNADNYDYSAEDAK